MYDIYWFLCWFILDPSAHSNVDQLLKNNQPWIDTSPLSQIPEQRHSYLCPGGLARHQRSSYANQMPLRQIWVTQRVRGIMGALKCCQPSVVFPFSSRLTVLMSTDSDSALALVNRKVKTWPERRVKALRFGYSKRTVCDFFSFLKRWGQAEWRATVFWWQKNGFSEIHISRWR